MSELKRRMESNLKYLNKIQPNFIVQKFIEYPCPWVAYDTPEYEEYLIEYGIPNHREILKNELVIDVDAEIIADGEKHADMVEERLKKLNIYFKRWKSGGNGQHFHLIFPELQNFFTKKYIEDIKYILIEFLLDGLINPKNLESHICLFKKKLIQIEYAEHRKGRVKTLVSSTFDKNKSYINYLPEKFYPFLQDKIQKKLKLMNRINTLPVPDNLNCINYFRGETVNKLNYFDLKRINYRTLFSLASYFKNKCKDIREAEKELLEWYNSIPLALRKSSVSTVNRRQIKILVERSYGLAGCPYRLSLLEELGVAKKICKGCPYNN